MESSNVQEGSSTADETAGSSTGIAEHPQQQPSHILQPETKKEKAQPQVFSCEICRVSCSDAGSYAKHMNSQRHKKRELLQSLTLQQKLNQWLKSTTTLNSTATQLFCKLCDVACDSKDAFVPYVRGVKHLRGWRLNTDDHYMINKHMGLYPPEDEMDKIDHAILVFEHALKLAFYLIAAKDALAKKMELLETSGATAEAENTTGKMATDELFQDAEKEITETTATDAADSERSPPTAADCEAGRLLMGAMRVGPLLKCVLLRGDIAEHLVVVCSEKPTRSLLQNIVNQLSAVLEVISPLRKFNVEMRFEESGLFVTIEEPAASFAVTLTSLLFDEDQEQADPPPSMPSDLLSAGHCLSALALLRHTHWLQTNLCEMKASYVETHVIRDFCRRNIIWKPLSEWAQELLIERCRSAAGKYIGPGEALRKFFECISSGILLPGGDGLMDPCEKVPTDVTAYLTAQQREEITASAQQFLQMLDSHQMYKILDVEELSSSEFKRQRDQDDTSERDDKKQKLEGPAVEGNIAASEDLPVLASD